MFFGFAGKGTVEQLGCRMLQSRILWLDLIRGVSKRLVFVYEAFSHAFDSKMGCKKNEGQFSDFAVSIKKKTSQAIAGTKIQPKEPNGFQNAQETN